jgi:HlyD family type I secretion membrane fusion protein
MTVSDVRYHEVEWYREVPRSIRKQVMLGGALIVLVFGGFGTWGALAPLAAAVISPGTFVATGENKVIQHLEGGIIDTLSVRDGETVEANQTLMTLDDTAALTNMQQLMQREMRLRAILQRLSDQVADNKLMTEIPVAAYGEGATAMQEILIGQKAHFQAWREKLDNDLTLLTRNVEALTHRQNGEKGQISSMEAQRELLSAELETKTQLLDKGLITRSEVRQLQRAVADADGDIARLIAEVQEIDTQISRYTGEMIQVRDANRQSALSEIQNVQIELDTVREQIRQARSVLTRTTIRSPVSGVVVRTYYHTTGGVVESGKPIMEILPSGVPLIIETHIPRQKIDEVKQGGVVSVRLVALNQRTTPILEGRLDYVSADSILENSTQGAQEVYVARVSISPKQLAAIPNFAPTPGMPVEVMVQTAQRTFFEYLTKPIVDSMSRAFRET